MEYADLHHPPYRRMTKSYSGLPTPVAVYNGPFIGRARALVDYIPSPYDRDALRFSVSILFRQCSTLGSTILKYIKGDFQGGLLIF